MFGIVILAVYAVLMIGVTLMFTRKTTDAEGFHVADRRIGSAIAAMSIAATWIWAPSLFTSSEMAYTRGIPGMFWFTVPNVLCLILFIPFAKRIRAQYPEGITLTGYMAERYHSGKVKGVYSFQLGALAVLSTAVQLLAGGKTLALITGLPFWSMTLALAAIAYSYSSFSGLKASIITDVVQLGIILMGGALLVVLSLRMTGGFDTVRAGLGAVSGEYTSLISSTGIEVLLGYGLPMAVGLISGPFGDQCFWQLKPNDYNPNKVNRENLKLLVQSIMTNGWTLPIVVRPDYTIIDGFHRWTVAGEEPLHTMLKGKVPVVIVRHDDATEDIYGTVTHNRARGTHLLEPMKAIVKRLLDEGKSVQEIGKQLGMKPEEVFRLSDFSRDDFLGMMTKGVKGYSHAELLTKL